MEERLVKRWIGETVEALLWLNDSGWVHRSVFPYPLESCPYVVPSDIKPHNLLLTGTGRLLLTDFNSAAPLTNASDTSTTRTTQRAGVARRYALTLIGTVDYIAPEILKDGESMLVDSFGPETTEDVESSEMIAYGKGVDVWSLGAVMYEVRTSNPRQVIRTDS